VDVPVPQEIAPEAKTDAVHKKAEPALKPSDAKKEKEAAAPA